MLAKLSGIITFEGEMLSRRLQSWTTGSIIATSGVLFMKALINTVGNTMRVWAPVSDCGLPRTRLVNNVIAPVSRSPAATTNSTATVRRPSLEKPAKASWGA